MGIYYIDGEFTEAAQAKLAVSDLLILRGFGIFDYTRTYGGKPFRLQAHLLRLQRSAQLLDLHCPWDIEELGEIVLATLARNNYAEAGIRILVTAGDSPNGFMPQGDSRLMVLVSPLPSIDPAYYERGAEVATVEMQRYLPEAKSLNYIPGIRAQQQALRTNPAAIEAIYRLDGQVIEGTRSNTFVFQDGRWRTPRAGLLLGITRAEVIKLLQREGRLEIGDLPLADYRRADEVIITSSTKEIVPIVKVDDAVIGSGVPGENTKALMKTWRTMTAAYAAEPGWD